jgi:glycosyltransferase involved in cell wall biosynthesis
LTICFFALEHHSLGSGGGIASYLDVLVPELRRLGHEVHLIVKGKVDNVIDLKDNSLLHEFKGGNIHWYLSKLPFFGKHLALPIREVEWSWGFYRLLKSLKKEYTFDLIESSETGNFFTALLEKKSLLVIRLHGSTYSFEKSVKGTASFGARLDRILQRYSFKKAKGITSPSEFQKRSFEKEHMRTAAVRVIPNPVSIDDFSGSQTPGNNTKTILYAGRIADVKGIWPLLKAFIQVEKKFPAARLVIIGASHVSIRAEAVRRFLDEHNIRNKVELAGHIKKDAIREYYKTCSLYVVPSYFETFSISAVEAMMYGKPVVASSGTALEEIVEDGITGLLVPPGDDTALADALLRLLNEDELTRRMGEAGRDKVMKRYSPGIIAQEILQFYETVISGEGMNTP